MLLACSIILCGFQVPKAGRLHFPKVQFIATNMACRGPQMGVQSMPTAAQSKRTLLASPHAKSRRGVQAGRHACHFDTPELPKPAVHPTITLAHLLDACLHVGFGHPQDSGSCHGTLLTHLPIQMMA